MFGKRIRRKPLPRLWRQGDVFIIAAPGLPSCVAPHRPVLAEGEVTGHAHRLADTKQGQVYRSGDGTLFLEVTAETAAIVHEEHRTITLPRGAYVIRIQREYHPEEIRRVLD